VCGKAAVANLRWQDIYAFASSLTVPDNWPDQPANRVNISPSRLRRKNEPESMVWETLPATLSASGAHQPVNAVWPFLPAWSGGGLPYLRNGTLLSTANARLRREAAPFAPTYMKAWRSAQRAVVWVSWFYEFDSRVKPQVPYAVFPLGLPCWPMAALYSPRAGSEPGGAASVAIITVEPNRVLQSVGHHRSPALLRSSAEISSWLDAGPDEALDLLRPYPDELMGVSEVPMGIKIPGNENVELPPCLERAGDAGAKPGN
jgi:putative SOS response-associated peptidase YedK